VVTAALCDSAAAMTDARDGRVGGRFFWVPSVLLLAAVAVAVVFGRLGRGEAGSEGGSWEVGIAAEDAVNDSGGGVVSFAMVG
jgi:hypothetical protein